MRKRATGKDFDAVMYRPHITMTEAGKIFGWGYQKFRAKFYQRLSRQIRSCRQGNRRFLSLIDTIRIAYPEADNQSIHMMAVHYTKEFLSAHSEQGKEGGKGKAEKRKER